MTADQAFVLSGWACGALVMAWSRSFWDGWPRDWATRADFVLGVIFWPLAIVVATVRKT